VTWDLTAIGDLAADLVLVDPDAPMQPGREILVRDCGLSLGGATGILAAAASRLGLRVRMVGRVGDDGLGRFILGELAAAGVDIAMVARGATERTAVTVAVAERGERALLTYSGTIATFAGTDVPEAALRETRHVHISSYYLQIALQRDVPRLLRAARAAGATTSLDTGDDPANRWESGIADALAEVDLFFPNEREAAHLGGFEDLARQIGCVALKQGGAGAALSLPNGLRLTRAAFPVVAIDTTGAGDVFNAGYLAAMLRGSDPAECLRWACAGGALATTWPGGQGPGLTPARIEEVLRDG